MGNTARTKVKSAAPVRLSPEEALIRLLAAAKGNVQQLRLPETKQPLEAVLLRRRDGSPVVILAVPSGGVGEAEALVAAQPVTLRGTLVAHNNGLYYLVTAQGVSVPLKVGRYGAALQLLAGQRVEIRGNYVEGGYFDVAEMKIEEEGGIDDDDDANGL